jgi:alkylated DNA repair dioxygenase AlkB
VWSIPLISVRLLREVLVERFVYEGRTQSSPDQVIVNEYLPGQGIVGHIDCVPCFGDSILAISLGSPCVIMFSNPHTGLQVPLLLEPGSLYIMQGDARYHVRVVARALPAGQVASRPMGRVL